MKIHVIDDDPMQLEMARAALEVNGYRDICVSADPVTGLDRILTSADEVDVLLLDILMPEIDGIEVCRRLRSSDKGQGVTIIMTTALADRSHIDGAFTAGADDYIVKPFDPAEIAHRLKGVSTRKPAEGVAVAASSGMFVGEDRNYAKLCGLTHHSAMEAYVRALDRGRASLSMATAFWVLGWDKISQGSSAGEEEALVQSCAEILKDGLKATTFVLSYYGDGVFVCVTRRADPVISSSLSRRLGGAIQELCGSDIQSARAEADLASRQPLEMIQRALAAARTGEPQGQPKPTTETLPDLFPF